MTANILNGLNSSGGTEEHEKPGRLVVLTVYYSLVETEVCLSKLDAYGIYAVASSNHARNSSVHMVALGGIEVKVVDCDLEDARLLLRDVEKDENEQAPPPLSRTAFNLFVAWAWLVLTGLPPAPRPSRNISRKGMKLPSVLGIVALYALIVVLPIVVLLLAFS